MTLVITLQNPLAPFKTENTLSLEESIYDFLEFYEKTYRSSLGITSHTARFGI